MGKRKKKSLGPGWSTAHEIDFLNHIGSHAKHKGKPEGTGLSKEVLVERYLKTITLRRNWDNIDPVKIIGHCLKLLSQLGVTRRNNFDGFGLDD